MLCMLLRKHLSGALIEEIGTVGFERAIKITFSCHDELGFECRRYIIAEIMGKYSNIILRVTTAENENSRRDKAGRLHNQPRAPGFTGNDI